MLPALSPSLGSPRTTGREILPWGVRAPRVVRRTGPESKALGPRTPARTGGSPHGTTHLCGRPFSAPFELLDQRLICFLQTLGDRHLCSPAELARGQARVQLAVLQLARAQIRELGLELRAGDL